jgi:hypothetical protein
MGHQTRTLSRLVVIKNVWGVIRCLKTKVVPIKIINVVRGPKKQQFQLYCKKICRNPTLAKCEDETHTPKVGDLESSGTPENSKLDCRGQNTLHWGVLDIIGKVSKCRCPKWPRMSHLDIRSPS